MADTAKKSVGLTDEQRQMLKDLREIEAATEAKLERCVACGSDLHKNCKPAPHHGGPSEARG